MLTSPSLLYTARHPYGAQPDGTEVDLPLSARGSVDTLRLNLYRASLNPVSRTALSQAGFDLVRSTCRDASPADRMEVWWNPHGVSVSWSRNGVTITIQAPRIAYGRNDRVADLRHAGLPALVSWLTDEVLADTTEAARDRASRYRAEWKGSHLVGRWRVTGLHLTVHLLADGVDDVDATLRILSLANLGRHSLPPRLFAGGDDGRLHGAQYGLSEGGGRSSCMVNVYDKGLQERDSASARRMLRGCGGSPLPTGRFLRFEVQLNDADAIARCGRLVGPAVALGDRLGVPALPFIDPASGSLASVLIDEERCHAVILDHLRMLLAYASPWRPGTRGWGAHLARATRFADRWVSEGVPDRCHGGDALVRALGMRRLLRRCERPLVQRFYPVELPGHGHAFSPRLLDAWRMSSNRLRDTSSGGLSVVTPRTTTSISTSMDDDGFGVDDRGLNLAG